MVVAYFNPLCQPTFTCRGWGKPRNLQSEESVSSRHANRWSLNMWQFQCQVHFSIKMTFLFVRRWTASYGYCLTMKLTNLLSFVAFLPLR